MIALRTGTKSDSDALAKLILSSAPQLLPYLYGGEKEARSYIRHAGQQPDGQYSANRHVVAVQNEEVIASVTFWDNQLTASFHHYTLQSIVDLLSRSQVHHLVSTNELIASVFRAPLDHELCVGHLAVDSKRQGVGVGKKLMAYAVRQAKILCKRQIVLDVESENEKALSFYNGLGFIITQSTEFSPTNQCFHRMEYML